MEVFARRLQAERIDREVAVRQPNAPGATAEDPREGLVTAAEVEDRRNRLVLLGVGDQEVQEELRPGVVWKRMPNLEDVYLRLTGRGLDKD